MRLRRLAYEAGLRRAATVPAPVVSVGNLTLGGTGKTPAAAWILERFLSAGRRPAVVSRGYGGGIREVAVVSEGEGALLDSPPAADEAVMIARAFPKVPVLTGRDRSAAARRAAEEFGADVLLLDDGFQRIALRREFDLVLLRGERPFGNGRVFPAGALREPVSVLRRADAILLTGRGGQASRGTVEAAAPGIPIFSGELVPEDLLDPEGNRAGGPADLAGMGVVAVSGIANPDGFHDTLSRLGARLVASHVFPDHARYTEADAARLRSSLEARGADLIVTTEKDAVKLAALLGDAPLRVLRVRMKIEGGETLMERVLEAARP